MDWRSFFIGIGFFLGAYLLRKGSKWAYGNPKAEENIYNYGQAVSSWIVIVACILCGIVFIIKSLPSTI